MIVIGAGITGLTAAKHAATGGLTVATIEALLFGGLVININELDGGPDGAGIGRGFAPMMEANAELGVASISARP